MAARATPGPGPELEGRHRVVIEGVEPEIDCGAFPAKAVQGDPFVVEADAFADGHDRVRCVLLHRTERQRRWREVEMEPLVNDRWRGSFVPKELGRCSYTLEAWVDRYGTWRHDLDKRLAASQDVSVDLEIGAAVLEDVAGAAPGADKRRILETARAMRRVGEILRAGAEGPGEGAGEVAPAVEEGEARELVVQAAQAVEAGGAARAQAAQSGAPEAPAPLAGLLSELDGEVGELLRQHDPRKHATRYPKELEVVVDRERAVFSAWYEFFPRSCGQAGKHGTFADALGMLPYVKELGFDVVYLPPIHPIGRTGRKGRNNRALAEPDDVGSPWGIGAAEGGHKAVHPALGTLDDFRRFRKEAEALGLEVALDVAFQVSPDHPWVREHPDWFRHRPDGSVQYAENPPKKYEDILPLDFETEDWRGLWAELRSVFEFWAGQGVRIFRVDNPHTKALAFWEWCVPALKRRWPDLILLSEAFTRPRLMYRLAKLGFTQSYTYFAWRHHRWDLTEYLTELTRTEVRHYFRPSFWPNTPDILTETLQRGGRPAFMLRLFLAATLSSSYGIYGPAFELLEHRAREPGSEEYLDSEKYQLRSWELERPDSLRHLIGRLNRARKENPALQRNDSLMFQPTDNEMLLAYSKRSAPGDNVVLCVVNLDPHHTQAGWTDLRLVELELGGDDDFGVHDLLSDAHYRWHGARNYVELVPAVLPAHLFKLTRRIRTERDFDYHG